MLCGTPAPVAALPKTDDQHDNRGQAADHQQIGGVGWSSPP
jgi:hypothetical protein